MGEMTSLPFGGGGSSVERWTILVGHRDSLLALARTRLPNKEDVEDVVQEVLILATYDPSVRLDTAGAWLNRVLRNKCVDAARKRALHKHALAYGVRMSVPDPPIDEEICDRDEARFLEARLRTLPRRQQEALLLLAQGLTGREIANRMNSTTKAIERLLAKGRSKLRQAALTVGVTSLLARTIHSIGTQATATTQAIAIASLVASTVVDSANSASMFTPERENWLMAPFATVEPKLTWQSSLHVIHEATRSATRPTAGLTAVDSGIRRRNVVSRQKSDAPVAKTLSYAIPDVAAETIDDLPEKDDLPGESYAIDLGANCVSSIREDSFEGLITHSFNEANCGSEGVEGGGEVLIGPIGQSGNL